MIEMKIEILSNAKHYHHEAQLQSDMWDKINEMVTELNRQGEILDEFQQFMSETPKELSNTSKRILLMRRKCPDITYEEIGKKVGIGSRAGVHYHIRKLRNRGYIN